MNKNAFQNIFPLPLTPFEEYMFLDKHNGYPMVVPITLVFEGKVDFELLSNAFKETISHEPLFHALVNSGRSGLCWVDSGNSPELKFVPENPIDANESRGIDPLEYISVDLNNKSKTDNQSGFQCSFTPTNNGFVIRLRIHHSVCDGMAIMLFVANWFSCYGELIRDAEGLGTYYPDPVNIKNRSELFIKPPYRVSRLSSAFSFLRAICDWFTRYLCRIRNCDSQFSIEHEHILQNWNLNDEYNKDKQSPENKTAETVGCCGNNSDSYSKVIWSRLPNDLVNAIQEHVREIKTGWSPFIMTEYFKFVRQWMTASESMPEAEKRNWIRILYPTNFRVAAHLKVPSSNILGFVFLDRRFNSDFCDDKFYNEIHQSLKHIGDWSLGAMFLTGLELCRKVPFLLQQLMLPHKCLTTSIFTTIGNPCLYMPQKRFRKLSTVQVGGLKLRKVIGSPPIRPNTPVSFAMTKQHNEITFSNMIDVNFFGIKNALLFHNLFIEQLHKTTGLKK